MLPPMADTNDTKVEYIETNESTNDATDKFWEIEVTKADRTKEVGVDYFTDNTYTYLRLGTTEKNTVYEDNLKVEQAAAATTPPNLAASFAKLKTVLQQQSSFIDKNLDYQRAEIDRRLPLMRAEHTRVTNEKAPLVSERDGVQGQLDALEAQVDARRRGSGRRRSGWTSAEREQKNGFLAQIATLNTAIAEKDRELAYYQGIIDGLTADRAALPADTTALIASLEAKKRAADTGDAAAVAAFEGALADAAGNAKVARRQSSTTDEKDRGDDLAAMIVDYYDDYRQRGAKGEPQAWISEQEREDESARIHTKGGWRDHTNGNRLSTTRGDKVEVIRGNYSLLVLGRQDEPGNGAKWESGGGHFARDNDTLTPGAVFEIRWVQDPWGGTWRCIEETTKGDVITRYQGNTEDVWYGDIKKSQTGTESAGALSGDGARRSGHTHPTDEPWIAGMGGAEQRQNPHIIDKTWARKIEGYTGSAACPIPEMYDETWAVIVDSKTFVSGTSNSLSIITNQTDTTINAAANTSVTVVPVKTDLTLTAAQFNFDFTVAKLELTAAAIIGSFAFAGFHYDLDMCGLKIEYHAGHVFKKREATDIDDAFLRARNTKTAKVEKALVYLFT